MKYSKRPTEPCVSRHGRHTRLTDTANRSGYLLSYYCLCCSSHFHATQADRWTLHKTNTDRQTHRNIHTGRQTDRHTDRQTHTHKQTHRQVDT